MTSRLALLLLLALAWLPAQAQVFPSFGEDRAGTAGFKFLNIAPDPRGAALGETVAAMGSDASAFFWNPALAAQAVPRAGALAVGAAHTAYHAEIDVNYVGVLYGWRGVAFGLSVLTLDAGEMEVTTETEPFGTGQTFGFVDFAAGLTVSQSLTDLFSYGLTVKYVRESTFDLVTQTAMLDLGVFYAVGTTGAQLGVAIRNFGIDGRPQGEVTLAAPDGSAEALDGFEQITPPTTFLLGVAYQLFRASDQHDLTVSSQLTNPNDNAERIDLGAEYVWNDLLVLRGGYQVGRDEATAPSLGFGVIVPGVGPRLRLDYGFSHRDVLGSVHRVGLDVKL